VKGQAASSKKKAAKLAFKKASDFVWAVRLHEISKGLIAPDITLKTRIKGATYARKGVENEDIRPEDFLEKVGLKPETSKLVYADKGEIFVIPPNSEVD
jgi:hypothetical protein